MSAPAPRTEEDEGLVLTNGGIQCPGGGREVQSLRPQDRQAPWSPESFQDLAHHESQRRFGSPIPGGRHDQEPPAILTDTGQDELAERPTQ